ncbi:MAG TPA: ergothioneine biosynthesis protein EgtB [Candidatus Limnocylindrales bacterium]|nr:ergothioneine biosynthesis protein EgtB [Candidatus Limnocylindrales bacterium]
MLRPEPEGILRHTSRSRPDLAREAFARSIIRGLGDNPRWLSCRYLYDEAGSTIFERITEQPEYYLTGTEEKILEREAGRIRELCGATTLVELGAGSATKTRHLLRAWTRARRARYVPIDISRSMLSQTCAALRREFRTLTVDPLAGSYEQAVPFLRELSPLTLVFLGSSVGNFNEDELDEFFELVTANLSDGDRLLLGMDLVKDQATLEAAYNDAAGWSSKFTLNLFARMNRELGTSVDLSSLEHVARWNASKSRIDIHAKVLRPVTIDLEEWGRRFELEAGEMPLVEISRKFETGAMASVAARHGFEPIETFTDPDRLFALMLLRFRRRTAPVETLRSLLAHELGAQRERTLEIVEPLTPADLAVQHCEILSPIVWDLGHIASFEHEWIERAYGQAEAAGADVMPASRNGRSPVSIGADRTLYDPIRHPRPTRGALALPDRDTALARLAGVREQTSGVLAATGFAEEAALLRDGYLFSMIAQHEAQHSETILQSIQLRGLPYEPRRRSEPPGAACSAKGEVFVPGGPFLMGTDDRAVAYDNERPRHEVDLDSFWIDEAPVTSGTYRAFVEDDGYRRPELWTPDGWRWLGETKVSHPGGWWRAQDGSWCERVFGRVQPLDETRPVVHVCWHEAQACARWLGKRLPTEAEWEKAAAWDLERGLPRLYPWGEARPSPDRANLDQRTFAPAAAGAFAAGRSYFGCHQMLGDVWEWTSSDFVPYPGFRVFPYPEYSVVHFGRRHKVLRGGSWATPAVAIRNTFRNWDLPERRQIFAGFRCARD